MSFGDLFWLIFIFAALQPWFRQRLLEAGRTRLIRDLERRRRSRVIALIHRQETMSLLGFPLLRFIDIEDSEEVLRAIQLTDPNLPIDFILHTPGGLVLAAEQIAHALVAHPAKVTVFVPHYAMSGGTLLALAADNIVVAPHAVLGPLDPQLDRFPAASILRAVQNQKERNKDVEDQTLILADMAEKAMKQVRDFVKRLLVQKKWDEAKAAQVAEVLTDGRWTHDYPITFEDARDLGLPVSTDMPPEVYRFMRLFPQTATQRPSVQYVPLPYGAPPQRSGSQPLKK
jgi:ClpP class serine protease